jgi:uncharacterized YccA/Bax inhibitor family protein
MQSSNPALSESNFYSGLRTAPRGETMTISGTINKSAILLLCLMISTSWIWMKFLQQGAASTTPWMYGGLIAGFVLAMVTIFKKEWAATTAPIYALCEGLFIGGISAAMQASFPGIAIQAALLTFGTLAAMLVAYRSGAIQVTEKFKLIVAAATGGIALLYLVSIALGFFGIQMPYIFGNGAIGIGFSLVVVAIAALNLVMDFDFIAQSSQKGLPKYMEWYSAFALLVTLVWLYIEMLRLLAKLRSRD